METELESNLLPCPFCGSKAKAKYIGNEYSKKRSIEIKCSEIHCRIKRTDSALTHGFDWLEEIAMKGWNRRDKVEVVK